MLHLWLGPPGFYCWIYFTAVFSCIFSPYFCLCFIFFFDLYVLGDDKSLKLGIFHANQTYFCLDPH